MGFSDIDTTVLIPVRNDPLLRECIASIDYPCRVQAVLNGSTTEYKQWAQSIPGLEIITTFRAGLGNAYNRGLESCETEFVVLMDSDCVFTPGTIGRIRCGLKLAPLVKGRVVFSHSNSLLSKTISAYRTFHTARVPNAYSPPLGLSRTVVKMILGHYFCDFLPWAEDYDFDLRVREKGLRLHYDEQAIVVHPPVSFYQDLTAAFNYGQGHGIGIGLGVLPKPPHSTYLCALAQELNYLRDVRSVCGISTAFYAAIWNRKFRQGFKLGVSNGSTSSSHRSSCG